MEETKSESKSVSPEIKPNRNSVDSPLRKKEEELPQPDWVSCSKEVRADFVKAQATFTFATATRTGISGHRQFDYANHKDVYDACHSSLSKNGFAITHPIRYSKSIMHVGTGLIHAGGYVEGWFVPGVPPGQKNQDRGLAITYAKRYSLKLCLGVPDADKEDVENAANQTTSKSQKPLPVQSEEIDIQRIIDDLEAVSKQGVAVFRSQWSILSADVRKSIRKDYPESMKEWQRNAENADREGAQAVAEYMEGDYS